LDEEDLDKRLVLTPLLERSQVGRGAVDLRLGTEFLLLRRTQRPGLDPGTHSQQEVEDLQERVIVPFGEKLWLHPRHFVLAATLEFIGLPSHLSAYVVMGSTRSRRRDRGVRTPAISRVPDAGARQRGGQSDLPDPGFANRATGGAQA
jgi:deoxycytidine triphosphate deaminase